MRISELGTALFGERWFTTGWVSVSYLKPIYPGDSLEVRGVLIDSRSQDYSVRLEFEVWVENQNQEKVSVGWIAGAVDA
jgi:acyl dehydratase